VDGPRVAFETIQWQIMAPGARHKMVERDGKRMRLLELTDSFIENDWCLKGHVGYLIEGELEFTFESWTARLKPGDGFLIRAKVDKHRARTISPLALLLAVEDVWSSRMLKNSGSALAIARDRVISSARPHNRTMNKLVVFWPTAERKHSIREGLPRAGDQEVAPDAPCLRDHPVSGVSTLREYDTVFQQPARAAPGR
jgi:hypothetical protein